MIFFILRLVSRSSVLAFRYVFVVFLKCLLPLRLILFRLFTLLWFGSRKHCILACFLWYNSCAHSLSSHGLCCFHSCTPRLSLAEVWKYSLIFSQALFFMSCLSFMLSKAADLFDILIWYSFPTFNSLSFLSLNLLIKLLCYLFTYCLCFPNFCNHQIVIDMTIVSPRKIVHRVYLNANSCLSICVQSDCDSSRHSRSRRIY